jgi:hypothetical protein
MFTNRGTMFEKIIVDNDLLALRQSASRGDIQAMFNLATHTVSGDKTRCCGQTTLELCEAIMNHPDFGRDTAIARNTFSLAAQTADRLHQEGKLSKEEATDTIRGMTRAILMSTAQTPPKEWNLDQLMSCVEWLMQDEHDRMEQSEQ